MTEGGRALWMSFGSTSVQAQTSRVVPRPMSRWLLKISKKTSLQKERQHPWADVPSPSAVS